MEKYIDDVVVKSKKQGDLPDIIKETFDNLRKYKMKLNPKKCVFGVIGQTAQLYGVCNGDRCKPEEGGSHRTIVVALNMKRNSEDSRHDGTAQPIHIQAMRT
jgi:hypothetical protein